MLTGAWAFVPGYRYHHDKTVLALAILGVSLLGIGVTVFHAWFAAETALTVAGASAMLLAHWKNRRLAHSCPVGVREAPGDGST